VNHTGANPQTIPNKTAVAIIPARFASSRLPGKPLLEIAGKPMICWVVERALAARNVARAIVATDDQRIVDAVKAAGYEAVMTRADHASGSDRLAEVAAQLEDEEIIVNVQGDEPRISPLTIERAVDALVQESFPQRRKGAKDKDGETGRLGDAGIEAGAGIVTTWEPIESAADVLNPDVVKVVVNENGDAVYFSRAPVPFPRDAVVKHGSIEAALANEPSLLTQFRKHTGLYVYRRSVLLEFASWPQSKLERAEALEQLRALEHGVKIKVIKASAPSIGVDTLEDLERVRAMVEKGSFALCTISSASE
jgi:3-deoxy-manno-octulosonate cytidylyltransferase (CMP-KDO synthetase)